MTDASGEVVWSGSYEAYGALSRSNGHLDFTPSYTGKQEDEDTGLYYFNARWYDPSLGRFITSDPARDGDNWYGYVENRPLSRVDSSGLIDADIFFGTTTPKDPNYGLYSPWASIGARPENIPTADQYAAAAADLKQHAGEFTLLGVVTLAAVPVMEAAGGLMAAGGEGAAATMAASAGFSGLFSLGSTVARKGPTALSQPGTYARAGVAMTFGALTGPLSEGLSLSGVNSWAATGLSSAALGVGNYLVQANLSKEAITWKGVGEAGLFSGIAGLAGKGLGDLTGTFGSKSSRIGSGKYFDPFTRSVSSESANGLQIMKTVTEPSVKAQAYASLVIDPFTFELTGAGLDTLFPGQR